VVEVGWESVFVLVAVAKVAARVAEVAMVCTAMINVVRTSKISACTPSARARYMKTARRIHLARSCRYSVYLTDG
jgi:hypothetical protein